MRQSNEIKNTNPLVNHILKEHIGWHTNAPKAGFGTRSLIMNLMNLLSEQEIVSLAENVAKKTNRDTILLLENEYTMRSALDFIEDWIKYLATSINIIKLMMVKLGISF